MNISRYLFARPSSDDWFVAFSPFWIRCGIDVLLECVACTDPADDDNALRRSARQSSFSSAVFFGGLGALSIYFCALKFAHPKAVSAFLVFSPIFGIVGCCCCISSLAVLCVNVDTDIRSNVSARAKKDDAVAATNITHAKSSIPSSSSKETRKLDLEEGGELATNEEDIADMD